MWEADAGEEQDMIVNLHKRQDGTVLAAACDSDVLGRKLEEGDRRLDLTGAFYDGKELDEDAAGDVLRNADHINVVGEKAVALALKEGLIEQSNVVRVQGIPHAEAALLHE